jgi:hypothetical protein
MNESERFLNRYKQVEKEADALGRLIGVRRLKPSEQTKIVGMTPDLSGGEDVMHPITGEKVTVSNRMALMVAAAVCLIDESPIPFPRNRGELDAIYDRLDREGLGAASVAIARLANDGDTPSDPIGAAKN